MKRLARTILVSLVIYAAHACGSDDPFRDDSRKESNMIIDTWFGFVGQCLTSAEEVSEPLANGTSRVTVKQKIACSPKMSEPTMTELTEKLDAWKTENCPETVTVDNATSLYKGCVIKTHDAPSFVSTTEKNIDEDMDSPDNCGGSQLKLYGVLECG